MGTGQDFARNLRTARERHGWSPTELARRCQAQGLTSFYAATVNRVEAGARQIRLEEAPALANAFHLTVEQMMFDDSRFDAAMGFSVLVEQMTALVDTLRTAGAAYEEARESTVLKLLLRQGDGDEEARLLAAAGFYDRVGLTAAQREQIEWFHGQSAGDVAMETYAAHKDQPEVEHFQETHPSWAVKDYGLNKDRGVKDKQGSEKP